MLDINDKWTKKLNSLIYIDRCLTNKEITYIKNLLNVNSLRLFVNLRYAPDPNRYDNMTKKDLLNELKFSRYD
jgi:hypothetical protein